MRRSSRPYIVNSSPGVSAPQRFETGAEAPETGIYRVIHVNHRLPHEVTLLKGDRFPRCIQCKGAVLFELVHAAPDLFRDRRSRIYELPVLDDDDSAVPA